MFEILGPRRMSERDLPSKIEMEQNSGGHFSNTVKSSKSVPALHEHTKQHEVFNPGYSRYFKLIKFKCLNYFQLI